MGAIFIVGGPSLAEVTGDADGGASPKLKLKLASRRATPGGWARSTGRICATVELPTSPITVLITDFAERLAGLLAGEYATPTAFPSN